MGICMYRRARRDSVASWFWCQLSVLGCRWWVNCPPCLLVKHLALKGVWFACILPRTNSPSQREFRLQGDCIPWKLLILLPVSANPSRCSHCQPHIDNFTYMYACNSIGNTMISPVCILVVISSCFLGLGHTLPWFHRWFVAQFSVDGFLQSVAKLSSSGVNVVWPFSTPSYKRQITHVQYWK